MTIEDKIQARYHLSVDGFTKQDVATMLCESGASYSDGYIAFSIQKMLAAGTIIRSARGQYKFKSNSRNVFQSKPDDKLGEMSGFLKAQFPFVDFCFWATADMMPLMHHIPNIRMKIVNCNKDAVEPVAHSLSNIIDTIVLPDPDRYSIDNVIRDRETVVVLPLISQAPVQIIDGIPTPRLEKILVDILCEEPLSYLRGRESYYIYETAFKDYEVRVQTLKRYAGRRNRLSEVETILKGIQL